MFEDKENSGFKELSELATDLIADWCHNEWYEGSKDDETQAQAQAQATA